jgi:PAS domain S-box-containing protein
MNENNELLRIITSNTLDVIVKIDSQGIIEYATPSIKKILGYNPSEIIGTPLKQILHPEDAEKLEYIVKKALSIGSAMKIQHRTRKDSGQYIWMESVVNILFNDKKQINGSVISSRDISELKNAEKDLKYRLEFEKIIMDVSASFIDIGINKVDENITETMHLVGDFAGSYVFLFYDNKEKMDNTHEWCAKGIEPQIKNLKGLDVSEFPWWMENMNKSKTVHVPVVSELPPEANNEKEILESQNIKSVVVVPLIADKNLIGFLGFDSVHKPLIWPDDILYLLRIVGDIISSAISQKNAKEELQKSKEELEIRVKERTLELMESNQALKKEIEERKHIQKQLSSSLKEKEMLLKEIYHRVKNNLMVISSLLNLQSRYIKDKEALSIFKESQSRANSMALIHEKLYRSSDLKRINFGEYVRTLSTDLFHTYVGDPSLISLNMDVENLMLDINTTVPLGLILNELVTNCMKHAFPNGRKGEICINFHKKEDIFILNVKDNGIGFPQDLDLENTGTLGMQLITSLTEQIDGEIELIKTNGTDFKIKFKELEYK